MTVNCMIERNGTRIRSPRHAVSALVISVLLDWGTSHAEVFVVPSPCCVTIQDGIDLAAEGDTVFVLSGLYQGDRNVALSFEGRNITLIGQSRDSVVIDGDGESQLLRVENGESLARVEEVTFANGIDSAVRIEDSSLTLKNTRITGCSEANSGGALEIVRGTVFLDGCILDNNSADNAGGAFRATRSSLTISTCKILGNSVLDNPGQGGGGHAYLSDIVIESTVFGGNWGQHGWGGGLSVLACSTSIVSSTFAGNRMVSNSTFFGGGGLHVDSGEVTIDQTAFYGNCTFPASGHDLWSQNATALIACSFIENIYGHVEFVGPGIEGEVGACLPVLCTDAPTSTDDYGVGPDSVLLPENNVCGLPIGALGQVCDVSGVTPSVAIASLPLRLEPNPARGVVRVRFGLQHPGEVSIIIQSVDGRRVGLRKEHLDSGEQSVYLDPITKTLPAGMYFIRVVTEQEEGTERMLLVR